LEYRNDKLYLVPKDSPAMPAMRVMRRGVYLGELKKKRFEPSQSFAMLLKSEDFDNVVDFKADSIEVSKYLKGETIDLSYVAGITEPDSGWVIVTVEGYPL
jgi:NOL1/NOP2/fmu family ribosome biogenesis protein